MAEQVHGKLRSAAARELVSLPEATPFAVLEKHRDRWIEAVARFLTKP
jgi:hypothetical protein